MQAGRSRWADNGKRGGRAWRPGLEQLESRLAPSVYQVSTSLDTPVADLHTGNDAAGHVSLRSAVAAANASPQSDTILLPAGAYTVPAGGLAIQGNLLIQGDGPANTHIQAQHLDRLFAVQDGHLELSGLDLEGGSASTPLQGDVHLTNCQASDADIAAVVRARLTSAPTTPVLEYAPGAPAASKQDIPNPVPLPTNSERLIGRSGGGASWQSADSAQEGRDAHQAFWRGDTETPPDQAAPDKPDDVKPKAPAREEASSAQSAEAEGQAFCIAQRLSPSPVSRSASEIVRSERWEPNQFLTGSTCQWFNIQNSQGIALVVYVTIGIGSLPRPGKDVFEQPGTISKYRQASSWRWSNLLRQTQRGPPIRMGNRKKGDHAIRKGRQKCLPFFVGK